MTIKKKLGNNIKNIRKNKKISQEKLAELCSLDRTYVQSIEKGDRNISLEVLIKLYNGLNIEITELLKGII